MRFRRLEDLPLDFIAGVIDEAEKQLEPANYEGSILFAGKQIVTRQFQQLDRSRLSYAIALHLKLPLQCTLPSLSLVRATRMRRQPCRCEPTAHGPKKEDLYTGVNLERWEALGLIFEARNNVSGLNARYFFSDEDFEASRESVEQTGPGNIPENPLSFGGDVAEWMGASAEIVVDLYRDLLHEATIFVNERSQSLLTCRQVEVLFGHLILAISRRVARATAQIGQLDGDYSLDLNSLNLRRSLEISSPRTSMEAYATLNSQKIVEAIEMTVAAIHFKLECCVTANLSSEEDASIDLTKSGLQKIKISIYSFAQRLLHPRALKSKVTISSSYLGRFQEFCLAILLGQAPALLEIERATSHNYSVRKLHEIVFTPKNTLDVGLSVFKILAPIALLEDFDVTLKRSRAAGYPENPDVIFTSNSFDTNDLFKVHLANALPDARYLVGQHGNNYGISKLIEVAPEKNTSDSFLTWGWSDGSPETVRFGQLKPKIRKPRSPVIRAVAILLRDPLDGEQRVDMHYPNRNYLESAIRLLEELDARQVRTELRMHTSTPDHWVEELTNCVRRLNYASIPVRRLPLSRIINSKKGVVFTYDSTGMLELASSGLPFFLFSSSSLEHVREEYLANYANLSGAGLLSHDPIEAATMIKMWILNSREKQEVNKRAITLFSDGIVFLRKRKLMALARLIRGMKQPS